MKSIGKQHPGEIYSLTRYEGVGNSGVWAYAILDHAIVLEFIDGRSYLYDYVIPGEIHVEQMKLLAKKGSGLTTYVNQHVREKYNRLLSTKVHQLP